jgi:hypothetical protein
MVTHYVVTSFQFELLALHSRELFYSHRPGYGKVVGLYIRIWKVRRSDVSKNTKERILYILNEPLIIE